MKAGAETTAARRSGRPSKQETGRIQEKILNTAAGFFFTEGYGATSIEAIAQRARVSKRTIYHRFEDKAEIFSAVVRRVIERLRPPDGENPFEGKPLEETLLRLARVILKATLSREALALYRVVLAEATRFPELALIVNEQGARRKAVLHIADLLENESRAKDIKPGYALFVAEQFLQMVIAAPQRRALGLGEPMSPEELEAWARDSVKLLLTGWNSR